MASLWLEQLQELQLVQQDQVQQVQLLQLVAVVVVRQMLQLWLQQPLLHLVLVHPPFLLFQVKVSQKLLLVLFHLLCLLLQLPC